MLACEQMALLIEASIDVSLVDQLNRASTIIQQAAVGIQKLAKQGMNPIFFPNLLLILTFNRFFFKTVTTRKSKTVGIHLNDDEYAAINARAVNVAARSLGAYIKAVVFDAPVPEQKTIRHVKVADPALIRQIAWIGNNVNQIARAVNQPQSINHTEAASIFAVLAIIAEER